MAAALVSLRPRVLGDGMRPVSETKWINCVTPTGDKLVFAARPELKERHKAAVVLIHDVLGAPGPLAHWFGRLEPEAELLLSVLPGHGAAPPLAARGWDQLVEAYHQSIRVMLEGRRVLVVGVGLGGVLALALNARGFASVAFDPFFNTANQWPIESALVQINGAAVANAGFLFDTLGWRDGALAENRSYGALLDRLKAPATIVCGDAPLEPPREAAAMPSLMEAADHALLAAYPGVRLQVLEGCGHDVLGHAPDLCREIILNALAHA